MSRDRSDATDQLRSQVASAADILQPYFPLDSFVAVNPLFGMVDRPFEQAVETARAFMSANGYLPEADFRAMHADGRIADDELLASIAEFIEQSALPAHDGLTAQVLRADMLYAPEARRAPAPVLTIAEEVDSSLGTDTASAVDRQLSKWCSAYFDTGESTWPMPGRTGGLYAAWRDLAMRDASPKRDAAADTRKAARRLPRDPAEAVLVLLAALGVDENGREAYIRRTLGRQPGWPSLILHTAEGTSPIARVDLVEYVAMALFYEYEFCQSAAQRAGMELADFDHSSSALVEAALGELGERAEIVVGKLRDADAEADVDLISEILAALAPRERAGIWLSAYERGYRDQLLAWTTGEGRPREAAPDAQAVFCIDARSASLRASLESTGAYETFGFAGFFALPLRWHSVAGGDADASCPVLLDPSHDVGERFREGRETDGMQAIAMRRNGAAAGETLHAVSDDTSSKFALAESAGWFTGPTAALRTLVVGGWASMKLARERRIQELLSTEPVGIELEERVDWARGALEAIGLIEGFAPIVLLCGHGSTSENNPYASSLDCGACGGHHGGPNARVAAAILNDGAVRESLVKVGIEIPERTLFLAGEHDTTLDKVAILDRETIPSEMWSAVERFEADLAAACLRRAELRADDLVEPGGSRENGSLFKRGFDWAQTRPEWGLARNAAFVVGPRGMTAEVDLGDRVFLHSYDAERDGDGDVLETILTAPMVVAHWINMQYYCSTVDPEVFGSGTKVVHNVVGRRAVIAGPNGDLRLGLPAQATHRDGVAFHEPMRLLTAVQAPLELIDAVIERNEILQQLFDGGWIQLAARGDAADNWQIRGRDGQWRIWLPAALAKLPAEDRALIDVRAESGVTR